MAYNANDLTPANCFDYVNNHFDLSCTMKTPYHVNDLKVDRTENEDTNANVNSVNATVLICSCCTAQWLKGRVLWPHPKELQITRPHTAVGKLHGFKCNSFTATTHLNGITYTWSAVDASIICSSWTKKVWHCTDKWMNTYWRLCCSTRA